jgi:hypothetical protein
MIEEIYRHASSNHIAKVLSRKHRGHFGDDIDALILDVFHHLFLPEPDNS